MSTRICDVQDLNILSATSATAKATRPAGSDLALNEGRGASALSTANPTLDWSEMEFVSAVLQKRSVPYAAPRLSELCCQW
jgi:hypothetical protein